MHKALRYMYYDSIDDSCVHKLVPQEEYSTRHEIPHGKYVAMPVSS